MTDVRSQVERRGGAVALGSPHVHDRIAGSTNERAKELAAAGAPHGTLVTADEQTRGRGRQGRAWVAPAGEALLMSLLLRGLGATTVLPLAAAVAVAEACDALGAPRSALKWPNDVWIDCRKVAGILIEGRPQAGWAVVGIGLNVTTRSFPPELADRATSLTLAGANPTVQQALNALLDRLARWVAAPAAEVVDAWRARDALIGRSIEWNGGSGIARGVDAAGALLVDHDGGAGRVTLDAGEVHLAVPR